MKINTSRNWIDYIPLDRDVQVSKSADFEACASYSATHIAEMLVRFYTGQFWEFSERALAKLSDTQPWGNSLDNVVSAIKKYGLLLDQDWEALTYSDKYENIDWATYYAPIPVSVLKKAYPFDVSYRKLTAGEIPAALQAAPIWTIIRTSGGSYHIVAQISATQYYDSYEIRVKNFQAGEPIQSQWQLIINPKLMTNSYLIQLNKKDGTKEFAVAAPATKEDTLIDKCLSAGLPIATLNNGQNIDWANLAPRFVITE